MRNSIHRFDLATGTDQPLPLLGLHEAVALDFDYEKNCLYWADISLDTIQVNKHLFSDAQYIGAIYWLFLTDIGEFVVLADIVYLIGVQLFTSISPICYI